MNRKLFVLLMACVGMMQAYSQTNPLWNEKKVKNYLPHMTVPEVNDFLTRSDMVIIPVGALEQHGLHLPIGTDFINGVERCKLIAQQRDILVAPVLMAGQSPYHMGFAGSITLKAETIIQVHMEVIESLIKHGFKRFVILNAHTGNTAVTGLLVDQVNQKTAGIAVSFEQAIAPFVERTGNPTSAGVFDRHGGTGETSSSLYLMPSLVQLDKAVAATLTLPPHMQTMLPKVNAGDPTATLVFLAEGLKAEETGKKTSSAEMSSTGVWGVRDPKESTAERGASDVARTTAAAVKFIDRWNELRPYTPKK
ncbi:MAG: creatininase family protein [Cytophagales bacterium]|nr:creatininase family protein [Cytophagales bacterium]